MFFAALANKLASLRPADGPLMLGISGAQGTGKSTLATFLQKATEEQFGWNVANLSLDDFYLTRAERRRRGRNVHPLLATRGVPGTHDIGMLSACLDELCALAEDMRMALPRFNKASDDRAPESGWPVVSGPVDLVILEGWCVGAQAQTEAELAIPINTLERDEDPDGTWRHYVNAQLEQYYLPVFERIDYLVFLQAPGYDAIWNWRLQQELELAERAAPGSPGVMNEPELIRFMQHYERLTRGMLARLPEIADIVYSLDETHAVAGVRE